MIFAFSTSALMRSSSATDAASCALEGCATVMAALTAEGEVPSAADPDASTAAAVIALEAAWLSASFFRLCAFCSARFKA